MAFRNSRGLARTLRCNRLFKEAALRRGYCKRPVFVRHAVK